jgi:large subunit ribosomal protein L25
MKRVSMSGSPRENVGKKDAKAQRRAGNIVCVLYGGEEQVSFTLPEKKFDKIIFTPEVYVIDLEIGDKKYIALLKDVQYHPVSDRVLHADFMQVTEEKEISVAIPVRITGTSIGVMNGGRQTLNMRKVNLKGLINNIPEEISIDVSPMKIGDSVQIKTLAIDSVSFLDNPSNVVVSVRTARGAAEDEEDEEGEEGAEGEETAATEEAAE